MATPPRARSAVSEELRALLNTLAVTYGAPPTNPCIAPSTPAPSPPAPSPPSPPSPPPAPAAPPAPVADAAAPVADALAATLPMDLLCHIFTPLQGDVETLSAAACVCVAWRGAALEPCHWRLARLTFAPRAARHLTDGALAALVRRIGGSLERINLAGCTGLTARGVAAALQDSKKLTTLAVRGVKNLQRGKKGDDVMARLKSLVRFPEGLDVRTQAACGHVHANGRGCARLCGAQDILCRECGVVRCMPCTAFAKTKRKPACRHLCDGCFHNDPDDTLVECGACGRVPNGFCADCVRECDLCDHAFCKGCCFSGGALIKCAGPGCDCAFCEDCGIELPVCRTCGKGFCEECAAYDGLVLSCVVCEMVHYCAACAAVFVFDGGVVCSDCLEDEEGSYDFTDEDEEWEDEDF